MRKTSFGEKKSIFLENILFLLRTRKIKKNLKRLKNIDSVIDVGCGYNAKSLQKLLFFFPEIKNSTGIDFSINENLDNKKINLIEHDLNKAFPVKNGIFDVVISSAVIEHLNDNELTIKEIHRILKPGGYLLLTTPSKFNKPILEFFAYKLKLLDETEIRDHKKYFTKTELDSILKNCMFKDVDVKYFEFGLNIFAVCKK